MDFVPPPKKVSALAVDRGEKLDNVVATTPGTLPDIQVKVVRPLVLVLVRAFRTFLQTLTGAMTAAGVSAVGINAAIGIPPIASMDFWHVLIASVNIALAAGVWSAIQNMIELTKQWDKEYPTLRA